MTNDQDRSRLREVEPLAPVSDTADADEELEVDDVAVAAAAGPAGVPAVGIIADAAEPRDGNPETDNPEVEREARR